MFHSTLLYNLHYEGTDPVSVVIPQGPDAVSPVLSNVGGTNGVVNYIVGPPESVDNEYRSPWQYTQSGGGTELEPNGAYTSVQFNSSGDIAYGPGSAQNKLALAWGSPDSYNVIEFLNSI